MPSPPVQKPLTKPRNTNSLKPLQHPWQVGENIPISETGKPRHKIKSFSEELRILSLWEGGSALDRWETRGCLNSESGPRFPCCSPSPAGLFASTRILPELPPSARRFIYETKWVKVTKQRIGAGPLVDTDGDKGCSAANSPIKVPAGGSVCVKNEVLALGEIQSK